MYAENLAANKLRDDIWAVFFFFSGFVTMSACSAGFSQSLRKVS